MKAINPSSMYDQHNIGTSVALSVDLNARNIPDAGLYLDEPKQQSRLQRMSKQLLTGEMKRWLRKQKADAVAFFDVESPRDSIISVHNGQSSVSRRHPQRVRAVWCFPDVSTAALFKLTISQEIEQRWC